MAYNEALTDRLRESLLALSGAGRLSGADGLKRSIEEKRMFRGVTFMVAGKMCVSVGDDEFMFRIDPELHQSLVEEEGVRSVVMKGREYIGYVRVHEDVVKTKRQLDRWVALALEFNTRAKSSNAKRSSAASTKGKNTSAKAPARSAKQSSSRRNLP